MLFLQFLIRPSPQLYTNKIHPDLVNAEFSIVATLHQSLHVRIPEMVNPPFDCIVELLFPFRVAPFVPSGCEHSQFIFEFSN